MKFEIILEIISAFLKSSEYCASDIFLSSFAKIT